MPSYSASEILESHRYEEPLIVGGVRCHGGFDAEGRYVSPRTLNRWPAVEAWRERLLAAGGALIDACVKVLPDRAALLARYDALADAPLLAA